MLKFYRELKVSIMFSPFEGGRGMILILNRKNTVLTKDKIIPLTPFEGGKQFVY
jgi:hypothetical protein